MIISDFTLNTTIFITTAFGFMKTAFADNLVDGVLGFLTICMAAGLSYIASNRQVQYIE